MFMASKYEDLFPLLMKTVIKKIGHDKITDEQVRQRELYIFKALEFKIGGLPSTLEFLTSFIHRVLKDHPENNFITMMSIYLAKMSIHHETLCIKTPSMIAASSIYVALKICEQMRKKTLLTK